MFIYPSYPYPLLSFVCTYKRRKGNYYHYYYYCYLSYQTLLFRSLEEEDSIEEKT